MEGKKTYFRWCLSGHFNRKNLPNNLHVYTVAKKVNKIIILNTQQTHLYKYINGRVIIIFVSLKHSKKN